MSLIYFSSLLIITQMFFFRFTDVVNLDNNNYEKLVLALIQCNDDLRNCNKPVYHIERFLLAVAIIINQ